MRSSCRSCAGRNGSATRDLLQLQLLKEPKIHSPMSLKTSRWLLAVGPAVIITLLAIYPVARLPLLRGNGWNGTFAYLQGDELIYAAYVNSLRTDRARSNNPYTGEPGEAGAPIGESAYSIQFLPAYAVALPARWFGLSTSAAFAVLLILI